MNLDEEISVAEGSGDVLPGLLGSNPAEVSSPALQAPSNVMDDPLVLPDDDATTDVVSNLVTPFQEQIQLPTQQLDAEELSQDLTPLPFRTSTVTMRLSPDDYEWEDSAVA